MECYNLYISSCIIELIYHKISTFNNKFNFIKINKAIYNKFKNNIKKYKISDYLNENYRKFHFYLMKYDYDKDEEFIQNIYKKAITDIPTVWQNNIMGYLDLRYIFELLYFCNIENERDISLTDQIFYGYFYEKIINIMVKNNRAKTLENIEKGKFLTCLKKSFRPNSTKNIKNWYYLKE